MKFKYGIIKDKFGDDGVWAFEGMKRTIVMSV